MIVSPGAWGVLRTNERIINDAIKKKYNRILILEDDVLFSSSFNEDFKRFIETINESWKILCLGATQHVWNTPDCLVIPNGKTEISVEKSSLNDTLNFVPRIPHTADGVFI